MADGASGSVKDSAGHPVKSILKKGKHKPAKATFSEQTEDASGSGIQWDEMNILMTEHPADKDYGHMKIEEPKTPYHELMDDEDEPPAPSNLISPEDLASRVQAASVDSTGGGPSKWECEFSDEEEALSEEQRRHKEEFRQWRKKHYNEFEAVKRARELIAQDLAEAEEEMQTDTTS